MKRPLFHTAFLLVLIFLLASIAYADYMLEIYSANNKKLAEKFLTRLAEKDYQAHIFIQEGSGPGKGPLYKVRVGPFATNEEATEQKRGLSLNGFDNEIIVLETTAPIPKKTLVHDKKPGAVEKIIPKYLSSAPAQNTLETNFENKIITDVMEELPDFTDDINEQEKATAQNNETESLVPDADKLAGISAENESVPDKGSVTLTWDANEEPDLAGYKIYYDTDPGLPYNPDEADFLDEGPSPIVVEKDIVEIALHGISEDKDYYFNVTSYDIQGLESDFSGEVSTKQKEMSEGDSSSGDLKETEPIAPGDTLFIEVPGQKEMTRPYDVDPGGYIYVMIAGKIHVGGLTVPRLKMKLESKLKKYLQKGETILVEILERTRFILVEGGTRYPGWYRVNRVEKTDEIIRMSGGLLPGADFSRIRLKRKTADGFMEIGCKGEVSFKNNDIFIVPLPKGYRTRIDGGDMLFVNIPQRQAPGRIPSQRDSADVSRGIESNKVEVDRNGYLSLPDYGIFNVKNRTPEEVRQAIIQRLPKYLQRLGKVHVSILEKKHYVQLYGHVRNPGWYNIAETANVQAAINKGGGAVDGAIMSGISLQRQIEGKRREVRVNLYQYSVSGDARLLTPLHENDVVFVPITPAFGNVKRTLQAWEPPPERLEEEAEVKNKVRIFGAVHNPGIYEPYEDMTLLDILVLASGEHREADLSNIVIIRDNKVEEEFNYIAYLAGAQTGVQRVPKVNPGDTVYVRYVKSKTWEPKEEELFYIIGKVKRPGQFKLWKQMTVLQAIALAGGLDEWADSEHITIVRMVGGKQENIPFNFKREVSGKYPELNIFVYGGDTIIVP